jgi:hypothetical protein
METEINNFYKQKSGDKLYINNICKDCLKKRQKEYRDKNKANKKNTDKNYYNRVKKDPDFIKKSKEYRLSKKEEKAEYDKEYRKRNKLKYQEYCEKNKEAIAEKRREYYITNKDSIIKRHKKWTANNYEKKLSSNCAYHLRRLKRDLSFKIRQSISKTIKKYLKINGFSKTKSSFLKNLPYSIDELKVHLEKQFEPWMSWDNWGSYRKDAWDDSDIKTWRWQIDHIIPQSDLPYSSMEEENFKKCWELANLRPLNAKQNLLDGIYKTRHSTNTA